MSTENKKEVKKFERKEESVAVRYFRMSGFYNINDIFQIQFHVVFKKPLFSSFVALHRALWGGFFSLNSTHNQYAPHQ